MKPTVHLICEKIDLGYHVHEVHFDKTKAEARARILREAYVKDSGRHNDPFFIETFEVQCDD